MLIALIPILFAVVGALVYAFAANPKVQTMGLVLFAAGVLVTTFTLARETFRLGAADAPVHMVNA